MNKEQDDLLCQKFPNLYRNRNASMRNTCMCYGFEVGEGWFQLIYDLSEKLEAEILKLPEDQRQYFCAAQVKEKFGGLRYYLESGTDKMWELASKAERDSEHICEVCGKPGEMRVTGRGWYYVSCEEHKE